MVEEHTAAEEVVAASGGVAVAAVGGDGSDRTNKQCVK
jgi:hypothetical protein